MIRLQDSTPRVYYEQSRDFQFIGRLFDIVLNSAKTNADCVNTLPLDKDMDDRLLNLLALTLGFSHRRRYNSKQLAAVCSVLPTIMRNKGSIYGVTVAVNAILQAEGLTQPLDYNIEEGKLLTLYLPTDLRDLTLLKDVMSYVLPAGMSCAMVNELRETHKANTTICTIDEVDIKQRKASELSRVSRGDNLRSKDGPKDYVGMMANATVLTVEQLVKVKQPAEVKDDE